MRGFTGDGLGGDDLQTREEEREIGTDDGAKHGQSERDSADARVKSNNCMMTIMIATIDIRLS